MSEQINTEQAAKLLGINRKTVYAWVRTNKIPHIRLGPKTIRFSRSVLKEWLAAQGAKVKKKIAIPMITDQIVGNGNGKNETTGAIQISKARLMHDLRTHQSKGTIDGNAVVAYIVSLAFDASNDLQETKPKKQRSGHTRRRKFTRDQAEAIYKDLHYSCPERLDPKQAKDSATVYDCSASTIYRIYAGTYY